MSPLRGGSPAGRDIGGQPCSCSSRCRSAAVLHRDLRHLCGYSRTPHPLAAHGLECLAPTSWERHRIVTIYIKTLQLSQRNRVMQPNICKPDVFDSRMRDRVVSMPAGRWRASRCGAGADSARAGEAREPVFNLGLHRRGGRQRSGERRTAVADGSVGRQAVAASSGLRTAASQPAVRGLVRGLSACLQPASLRPAAAMLLLAALLLAARPASAASPTVTTLSEQEQEAFFASAFSAFDSAQTEVAQDEPASCRCVTPACCGRARGTTLTPAQTSGVGLLEERSGLDGDMPGCLRAGNICCDLADIENTTQCQQDAGSKNGTEHPSGEDRCGTRGSIASHGDVVSPGQFPWLVTVWERGGKYLLGAGALIHPRLVITAAHIVEDEPVDSLLVRLGNGSAGLAVAEAALHSDWAGRARYHDLAVLRLAAPAELGPHVLPACLGPATLDPGAPFRLTGCQTVQIVDEELPTSLRASNVRLLSRSQCEAGLKATGKLPQTFGLHYSFTCAAAQVGSESACRTESGAPLTCADPGRPGRTVLVGLLSWNAGCRAVRGWPDVYTRLADVDSFCWLERTVTRMLGEEWPHFGERSACELGRPERATE